MIASIEVPISYNLSFICELVGQNDASLISYRGGILYVEGVTQESLDNALSTYGSKGNNYKRLLGEVQSNRAEEYPELGEQLDAIWKELSYRRLQGENLVSDADNMLGKILSVKKKYPKPTEGN